MNWESGDDPPFWVQSRFPASGPDVMWADCQSSFFIGFQLLYLPCYDWLQIFEIVGQFKSFTLKLFLSGI